MLLDRPAPPAPPPCPALQLQPERQAVEPPTQACRNAGRHRAHPAGTAGGWGGAAAPALGLLLLGSAPLARLLNPGDPPLRTLRTLRPCSSSTACSTSFPTVTSSRAPASGTTRSCCGRASCGAHTRGAAHNCCVALPNAGFRGQQTLSWRSAGSWSAGPRASCNPLTCMRRPPALHAAAGRSGPPCFCSTGCKPTTSALGAGAGVSARRCRQHRPVCSMNGWMPGT